MPTPRHDTPTLIMRRSRRLFLIIFMLTGSVISGLMMVFYQSEIKTQLSNLKLQETFAVELQSQVVGDTLESVVSDLFFLREQNELHDYLRNRAPGTLDKIASEYRFLVKQKRIYDQARLIDSNGMETVRVNFNRGSPVRVAKDKLQLKRQRYYFKDTFALEKGVVFISPFDLNIENGGVEEPFKPMIRIATPVFDSEDRKSGIVILNYLGDTLLQKILALDSVAQGKTMLLNADGYWLHSPDPKQEWGFMFNDTQRSFSFQYKKVWQTIQRQKKGQLRNSIGLFTFKTIYPLEKFQGQNFDNGLSEKVVAANVDAYHWHLVSLVPAQTINSYSSRLMAKLFVLGVILFLLVAGGSWVISLAITRRMVDQAHLKLLALFDPLTELPNRRLFFDRLRMALEHGRRNKSVFGLLYIDLDGFKGVNDTYGHEAGDELLRVVAGRLSRTLRKSDTVARLGGDEFAIIIDQLDSATGAEIIAEKILSSIAQPIPLKSGDAKVGASIGIAMFPEDADTAEALLQMADKAMYVSKNQGKNRYTFNSAESF